MNEQMKMIYTAEVARHSLARTCEKLPRPEKDLPRLLLSEEFAYNEGDHLYDDTCSQYESACVITRLGLSAHDQRRVSRVPSSCMNALDFINHPLQDLA